MKPFALVAVTLMSMFNAPLSFAGDSAVLAPVEFERQTLDNGLRVIYAPLRNAPVVHVQVLYEVGSRDEDPERQGFAHMFEHMMFRGSAHVASEQHMKLINGVGGNSNASTSNDWTRYVNTIPANHTEMALYLEADRMSSFKVNRQVLDTEINVVSEEWRLRTANPPYGTVWQDFFKMAYKNSHYKWTTIGDMDQLRRSTPAELQSFFNTYYVPNNAVLIVAGDIDVPQTKAWVQKYFGWIPKGPAIKRVSPAEAEPAGDSKGGDLIVYKTNIPLTRLMIGYLTADWRHDDHYALDLIGTILGSGRSSRLHQALVASEKPLCSNASAGDEQLADAGQFMFTATVLPGQDSAGAREVIDAEIQKLIASGVTDEELAKAKLAARLSLIGRRRTAQSIAATLGDFELFGGDANLVNTIPAKIESITSADLQAVAKKYLQPSRRTVLEYRPGTDPAAKTSRADFDGPTETISFEELPATKPTGDANEPAPRVAAFPANYPGVPPFNKGVIEAKYDRGVTFTHNGVTVIVLSDNRLPTINWTLTMRGGSHSEPAGKDGVAQLAAGMLTRGVKGLDQAQLAADLENRGIRLNASDGGDTTEVSGSATADQFQHAIGRTKQLLTEPTFAPAEFEKLKRQSLSGLTQQLSNPAPVAQRSLTHTLYGDSPLGRQTTLETLGSVTLEDVRAWYEKVYGIGGGAVLVFAGAIDEPTARTSAAMLLDGLRTDTPPKAAYDLPAAGTSRKILLIDNPAGQQATIRVGIRAFDNKSDDKYAANIATQVLSSGIDSRLNRVLRAEKGLTYGAYGRFASGRYGGTFTATIDTKPTTAGESVEGIFQVLDKMRKEPITAAELDEAKLRTAGAMVMDTQTPDQQAGRRVDILLNGYPDDYYEQFPKKIAAVTTEQVQAVMNKYVDDQKVTVVVVGPAEVIKPQLDKLGEVVVEKMPVAPQAGRGGRGRGAAPPAQ